MYEDLAHAIFDGSQLAKEQTLHADAVVVGSGPGGATVARDLAMAGLRVVLLEEGRLWLPQEFPPDAWTANAELYRNVGATLAMGNLPLPLVQGCAVGGTSVINGAISWRLPKDVHQEWLDDDPKLAETLPWEAVSQSLDRVEQDLHIHPTPEEISGPNNLLLGKGAQALGYEHRPISRNVRGCRGLGRCMQGCPEGHKLSMDRTYIPEALQHQALLYHSVCAKRILHRNQNVEGIEAQTKGGGRLAIHAPRVIIAAGALHSPLLLWKSGLRHPMLGKAFQCHPGVGITGRFPTPVRMWEGATQGHEVTGLRREGIKVEALGFDMSFVASRLKSFGEELSHDIADLVYWANWGAAIRAEARGSVKPSWTGQPKVSYSLTKNDLTKIRRGIRVMGEIMLAAGASFVYPGIHNWDEKVSDPKRFSTLEQEVPLHPKYFNALATHLFGTCRLHSDPQKGVIDTNFQTHTTKGLFVSDASIFPSNTGVNPQTSIVALAHLCAASILQEN
ncbi:MAG: GMC family oxidoreductase [Myxococcales bacterium]|nr:GMC family oxidoreductase [Myxococcales bacterium]